MLFANLEVDKTFRFRNTEIHGTEVYRKVGPDHYRKNSAGIHACCLPINSTPEKQFEAIDPVEETTMKRTN